MNSGSYEYEEAIKRAEKYQERMIRGGVDLKFFNIPMENWKEKENDRVRNGKRLHST